MILDHAFLFRVNHDLRGELSTIVAGAHYLARYEPGLSEPGRQMLERVNGAGQRLRRLLDELELASWIGGRPAGAPLAQEPCRLGALVEGALGALDKTRAQRRVTVDVRLPEGADAVEADPDLLGAALEHLLDFAVARSPDRTVRIAGGAEELQVADAGGPVDDAALARIFEPFAEKDLVPRPEPGARRRERLGLGLAIARGIVSAHGGALTATSSPEGVTFALRLGAGCQPTESV